MMTKQRTGNLLFSEVIGQLSEFNPVVNQSDLSISFRGDFWINQRFFKLRNISEEYVGLGANLDFIPPDIYDEKVKRGLYQKLLSCDLDALYSKAYTDNTHDNAMVIGKIETWHGSRMEQIFKEFYIPTMRSMMRAEFCIDILLGNTVEIAGRSIQIRYSADGSRMISSIIGAYQLTLLYEYDFHQKILDAVNDSLSFEFERNMLRKIAILEYVPEQFMKILSKHEA